MSTFFRTLERAEPASPSEPSPAVSADTAPAAAPQSVFTPPRPAATELGAHVHEFADHLVSLLAPASFEAEQYRALRHMIEQLHRSAELSVVGVSSADAADGKTTTAINLAGALAQDPDARVLLVDADLRGANLAGYLGLDEGLPVVDAVHTTLRASRR
jgi:Mrp family chromosome partitioning ATPase